MSKQQNQVRPRMSRESYEWLKSIEGKTNDERIEKLKANEVWLEMYSDELAEANIEFQENTRTIESLNQCLDITGKEKIRIKSERDSFIGLLCVSMVINFGLLGYVATLQGWF